MKNNLILAILGLVMMSAWLARSGEEAPIDDGTFLVYDIGGSLMRVTFSPTEGDVFSTSLEYADEHGEFGTEGLPAKQGDVVDAHMRTADGRVFELASLGPLWVPPSEVHEGGKAHGTRIADVRRWENWEVGVVTAAVGMGAALRGEWYYDTRTGFLVGGTKSTAVSAPGQGMVFTLTDSNLPDLGLR
ncbi:MAG: hypothetical protein IIB37_07765 [Gemmatimonadetes bacterium]|nr:hypothetical protein [Gemmatimonadota bacterium]